MRVYRFACPLIALVVAAGAPAQTTFPPSGNVPSPYLVQPLSDSDLLANEIRVLTANPLDVNALVRAGELAVRIADTTAAATFFARAERIDPRNARLKAGEGSLLVATERPGEALRRFAEAEALGGDVRGFAADRGLAYDLVGEQDRAQRDYRLALRSGPNDETQRRYALSLGISSKRDLALAQIDPLLRRSDRGAWRTRAFILAMAGDGGGAEKIATSMMPAGLAEGLQAFFVLLPTLGPADRAFAVHFGEVRSTPERQFDARLVPPLAALPPDPSAPVAVAAVARPVAVTSNDRRKRKRDRGRVEVAAVVAPSQQVLPPAYRPPAVTVQSAPVVAPRVPAPEAVVARAPVPQPAALSARTTPAPVVAYSRPAPVPQVVARASGPSIALATVTPAVSQPTVVTQAAPAAAVPVPVQVPRPAPVRSEASILASILSDIKVPPSELEGTPMEPTVVASRAPDPAPVVAHDPAVLALAQTRARQAAEAKAAAEKTLADKKAADKKLADKKVADKKLADAKALADKKAAEDKKKRDPKLLEPSRLWVQVAGGATERDLAKEWTRVRGKAAVAFKGRQGWTTPLRATNRVLTGPFKSEDEAQAFVNTVAKDGISAFLFTSEAGQKVDKLPVK